MGGHGRGYYRGHEKGIRARHYRTPHGHCDQRSARGLYRRRQNKYLPRAQAFQIGKFTHRIRKSRKDFQDLRCGLLSRRHVGRKRRKGGQGEAFENRHRLYPRLLLSHALFGFPPEVADQAGGRHRKTGHLLRKNRGGKSWNFSGRFAHRSHRALSPRRGFPIERGLFRALLPRDVYAASAPLRPVPCHLYPRVLRGGAVV